MDKKIVYMDNSGWVRPVEKLLRDSGYFDVWVKQDSEEDEGMLAKCWAMVPGRGRVTEELLNRAPNLKIVCKSGVGLERIDIPACTARGICVANTPQSNAISVAEHTIALMLAAAKRLYPFSLYIRNDYPDFSCTSRYPGVELYGKTLVVIGVGSIGSRVAKICDSFGMKIIGVDPVADRTRLPDYIEWAESIDEALPKADFVTVHVSASKDLAGLIGEKQFALMKETAIFVNTSRGFIVDEPALYQALANKRIAGAGLDVFAEEPFKPCNPLMHLENLVATPHSAANTPEARRRGMEECARIIKEYAEGKRPTSAANNVPMG